MNTNQENRQSSYFAIDEVLKEYIATWTPNVAFGKSVGSFRGGSTTIQGLVEKMSLSTRGTTELKHTNREAMSAGTLELAGDLCGFASVTGDTELLAKVDLTPSDL